MNSEAPGPKGQVGEYWLPQPTRWRMIVGDSVIVARKEKTPEPMGERVFLKGISVEDIEIFK